MLYVMLSLLRNVLDILYFVCLSFCNNYNFDDGDGDNKFRALDIIFTAHDTDSVFTLR